jgi:thymidylate synthase
VHIWDGNGSREFLNKRGLSHYDEGELGPVYGYQWRNWGKDYTQTSSEPGIDQLQTIINTIRTNPYDRRMILSAWNVSQLNEMALPPCHLIAQFYVHETNGVKYLSCSMYQRSADVFLGVPFNIASYALLTHMIAQVTGTVAYELITHFGDTHLYSNHVDQARTQIERYKEVKPFCKVVLNQTVNNIDDFVYDDIQIQNYECCPGISAPMAV